MTLSILAFSLIGTGCSGTVSPTASVLPTVVVATATIALTATLVESETPLRATATPVRPSPTSTATHTPTPTTRPPTPTALADAAAIERGRAFFRKAPCGACHANADAGTKGGVSPELTHIGTVAAERLKDPNYKGEAKDAAGYIRESIVNPSAYIAPDCPTGPCIGPPSIMPINGDLQNLTPDQLNELVAYLASLR